MSDEVRGAVRWLVASLAQGTDAEQVASHLAPRLCAQGDMVLALSRSPRFAGFRDGSPVIETIDVSESRTATALVSTGTQRWELEVHVEAEPPYLIDRFSPRPIASDAVMWTGVVDRLRAADGPAESSLPTRMAHAIHDRLVCEVNERRIPGLAAGIAVAGQIVHVECLGLADIDSDTPISKGSVFQLGSVTKLVTALGVLALAADGRVDLNTSLSWYLPAPTVTPPGTSGRTPTVRDLLLHNGGLPRDVPEIRRALQGGAPLADAADEVKMTAEPGVRPEYSNLGYVLLGAMIECVAGEPLSEFLTSHVLTPLGMNTASLSAPGLPGAADVTGYRLAAGTLAAAPPYVSAPGAGGATGTLSDALTLAMTLAAGSDPLVRLAAEITGPSPIPGALFCPGYAITDRDLPNGRRLLHGAPTAWKEGASDGFTAEITATADRNPEIAVAILANKTPPDSFGRLNADVAAFL